MFKKALLASALLAAGAAAQAQSANWVVQGTITPGLCTIAMGGSGVVTIGTKSVADIQAWGGDTAFGPARYASPNYPLTMTVSCPAPTRIGYAVTDNRAGTQPFTDATWAPGIFGLGTSNGANIGGYTVSNVPLIKPTVGSTAAAPGTRLRTTGIATAASTFAQTTGVYSASLMPGTSVAYATAAATTTPSALTEISETLNFNVHVLQSLVDAISSQIVLDGAATVTLTYL